MDTKTSEKIIDWSPIIEACGDESIVQEIIAISLNDAGQSIDLLSEAITSARADDVKLYAHRLKGIAMTIGANRLSELAYSIEHAGGEKDVDTVEKAFEDVKIEFEKVRAFLARDDWMELAKEGD